MSVAAFDLSLTATGIAQSANPKLPPVFSTFSPAKGYDGLQRLTSIRQRVLELSLGGDLVVMEGLAYGKNDPSAQERAGLAYLIRMALWERGQPFVLVTPSQLKKFATGKGNSEKAIVIREVWRRWNCEVRNDNEADAVVLCQIGRCLLGEAQPDTEPQREVLKVLAAQMPRKEAA